MKYVKSKCQFIFFTGYFLLLVVDVCKGINFFINNEKKIAIFGYLFLILFIILNYRKLISAFLKYKTKDKILFILLIITVFVGFVFIKSFIFIRLLLFLICAKLLDFSSFIEKDFYFKLIITLTLILLPILGIIDNNILLRSDMSVRYSFGFKNPNVLSLYISLIIIDFMYLSCTKYKFYASYLKYLCFIMPLLILFVYFVANSRTTFIIMLILYLILIFYDKICIYLSKILKSKVIKFGLKNIFLFFLLATLVLVYFCTINEHLLLKLDDLFSNRFTNYIVYIKNVGFSFFGNYLPYSINNSYMDSVYLYVLLNGGIIMFFYFNLFFSKTFEKALKNKEYIIIFILIIICLSGFTDSAMSIVTFNFYFLYFIFEEKMKSTKKKNSKYFICENVVKNNLNALSKARKDCEKILLSQGFKKVQVTTSDGVQVNKLLKFKQLWVYFKNFIIWKDAINCLNEGDLLVIQYPLLNTILSLNTIFDKLKNKNVITILLVHDLDSIRFDNVSRIRREDKSILKKSSYIISHNEFMTQKIVKMGNDENKIVDLKIFDYLHSCKFVNGKAKKDDQIVIAGNLSYQKSKYIYNLDSLKNNFNLYGVGYIESNKISNISYSGSYDPDVLPSKLQGSFGLVWDGDSLNSCVGCYGNYLKYNNPHKASLYLASGLPIIVWNKSALSNFVNKNNLGFAVDSLFDIDNIISEISDNEYDKILKNVSSYSVKIKNGYFLKTAIKTIENKVKESK